MEYAVGMYIFYGSAFIGFLLGNANMGILVGLILALIVGFIIVNIRETIEEVRKYKRLRKEGYSRKEAIEKTFFKEGFKF